MKTSPLLGLGAFYRKRAREAWHSSLSFPAPRSTPSSPISLATVLKKSGSKEWRGAQRYKSRHVLNYLALLEAACVNSGPESFRGPHWEYLTALPVKWSGYISDQLLASDADPAVVRFTWPSSVVVPAPLHIDISGRIENGTRSPSWSMGNSSILCLNRPVSTPKPVLRPNIQIPSLLLGFAGWSQRSGYCVPLILGNMSNLS